MRTDNCALSLPRRCAYVILLPLVWSVANAQQTIKPSTESTSMAQLHRMPGKLVSQGKNQEPVGELELKTYLLEELQLDRPVRAEIGGQNREVNRGWRLTITGGPFTVRDMPAMIWIDDKLAGYGVESIDLQKISVVLFDRSLLREGAVIALSYGEHDPQRTELPERLTLNPAR